MKKCPSKCSHKKSNNFFCIHRVKSLTANTREFFVWFHVLQCRKYQKSHCGLICTKKYSILSFPKSNFDIFFCCNSKRLCCKIIQNYMSDYILNITKKTLIIFYYFMIRTNTKVIMGMTESQIKFIISQRKRIRLSF